MEYCFDIKPSKSNKKLNGFLLETQKELSDFFGITIKEKPNIFFLHSRKEIDTIWGKKTEPWFCAWAKDSNIYILHPSVYTKESDHTIAHFWQTIKHESSHLYFKQFTGINYPKWLNEGLACYLAGQKKKNPTLEDAVKVFDYFRKGGSQVYGIGYFWVKLLIEKFGKKKFITFLKQFNSGIDEQKFAATFHTTYKIRFNKKELEILFRKNIE